MRPRVEIILALLVVAALSLVAGVLGSKRNRIAPDDFRRSSFLSGPYGAKGYAEVLKQLHVRIDRFRQRSAMLSQVSVRGSRPLLAVLSPSRFDGVEARGLVTFAKRGDLLLAGFTAAIAMQCFGYDVDVRDDEDSIPLYRVREGITESQPVVHVRDMVLAQTMVKTVEDSSDLSAGTTRTCQVEQPVGVDTLLVTSGGRPAALELTMRQGGRVILVADGLIFSNRKMRDTDAGLVTVRLAATYDRVIFDEFVHGFAPSGSLFSSAIDWSLHSPWGWFGWQLIGFGLLALLAGAVRFGAPRKLIDRRRRSPLEHVRALATALKAAKGADVAVDLMVRGLRRRLSAGTPPARGQLRTWLEELAANVRTPRSKQAVATLLNLTRRASSEQVLRAANAVEDVWQDLTPPTTAR